MTFCKKTVKNSNFQHFLTIYNRFSPKNDWFNIILAAWKTNLKSQHSEVGSVETVGFS